MLSLCVKAYVSRTETLFPSCSYEVPAASIISPVIVRELAELWRSVARRFTSAWVEECSKIYSLFHLKVAINVLILTPQGHLTGFSTIQNRIEHAWYYYSLIGSSSANWQSFNVDLWMFKSLRTLDRSAREWFLRDHVTQWRLE